MLVSLITAFAASRLWHPGKQKKETLYQAHITHLKAHVELKIHICVDLIVALVLKGCFNV